MRVAAATLGTGTSMLVAEEGDLLRQVAYDDGTASWRVGSGPPFERGDARLERPFVPLSVIAPGPRIVATDDWAERHREFHVKPSTVLAPPAGPPLGDLGPVVHRVQAGMVFAPTPRLAVPAALRRNLIGLHLVVELVSCDGFTLGWEGPRWHLRYAEGLSFDGSCPATDWLVTPDELEGDAIVVEHAGGETALAWPALWDFARFVNRYLDLGPHTMVLAGWPLGPTLQLDGGAPILNLDAPILPGSAAWAAHARLGRVERFTAAT
jgi:hypothetical protein